MAQPTVLPQDTKGIDSVMQKWEMKSRNSALLKLSEEADPLSRQAGLDDLHRSLPVPTTPGFCAPNPMMEHTPTSRALSTTLKCACPAYSSMFPVVPEWQRGTSNHWSYEEQEPGM